MDGTPRRVSDINSTSKADTLARARSCARALERSREVGGRFLVLAAPGSARTVQQKHGDSGHPGVSGPGGGGGTGPRPVQVQRAGEFDWRLKLYQTLSQQAGPERPNQVIIYGDLDRTFKKRTFPLINHLWPQKNKQTKNVVYGTLNMTYKTFP